MRYGRYIDDAVHINDIVNGVFGRLRGHHNRAAFGVDGAFVFEQGVRDFTLYRDFEQVIAVQVEGNRFTGCHDDFTHSGVDDALIGNEGRNEGCNTCIGNRNGPLIDDTGA